MTERFLKAKHWQLFLLTFGIPVVFQFGLMGTIMARIALQPNPDHTIMLSYVRYFPLMMVLFLAVLYGWYWSVAIGLQKKVPENVTMKVKKFKVFFFIPLVYLVLFLLFFTMVMNSLLTDCQEPDISLLGRLIAVVFALNLFAIFCMFYCLYFVAKTFKTVELQREVTFGDFIGEFFLIWFYPIGIWVIQPKINKMVEE